MLSVVQRSGESHRPFVLMLVMLAVSLVVPTAVAAQSSDESEPAQEAGDEPIKLAPPESTTSPDEPSKSQESEEAEKTSSEPETDEEQDKEKEADEADGETSAMKIPEVEVIGRTEKDVESVPGSAEVVSEEELDDQIPLNTNEAMRMVPGVHVQPEEGMGLRQNIGIRGLNPTRSRKVHVMEDGVPIALAPYGEPEMYYSPPIERMSRIEVVKGSGAILFGPQTIGGVVNYITPQPPEEFTVTTEARGGTFDYYQGEVSVGDTTNGVGYWLNGMHQRFGGHRGLDLRMTDFTSKFKFDLDSAQSLSLKFNIYDELSNSTYLGLTRPQYEEDPSFNFASNDQFDIRRYGIQATHVAVPNANLMLETRLYGHNIERLWRRQDFDRAPTCQEDDCYDRVISGSGENIVDKPSQWRSNGSQIFFRNSTGNRNREFTVGGVEPRATIYWGLGPVDNELQAGVRFHIEHTRERRINGNHPTSLTGTIRNDDERIGRALAAYALNRFKFFDKKLEISPGLRFESLWTERTVYRTPIAGDPTDIGPPFEKDNHIMALIPGGGVSYNVVEPLTLFGGVHRGFAPPRTKDAITKEGRRLALEPEYSWNYEAGVRVRRKNWLRVEMTGFILDFQNQIIAPAEAGGAVSADPEDQDPGSLAAVQGGQTIHRGLEFGGTFDPASLAGSGMKTPISLSYTFVDAKFQDGWKTAIVGNELPYSPKHRLAGRVAFKHPTGFKLQVDGDWLSGQFTDKVETVPSNPAGLKGWIESRFLLDANVSYTYEPWGLTAFVAGKNLLNEQYISSRAPRGIKPGLFRHVYGGLRLKI